MRYIKSLLQPRFGTRGVTALEYGLIAAVVGIVMVIGASQLGTNLRNVFSNVSTFME